MSLVEGEMGPVDGGRDAVGCGGWVGWLVKGVGLAVDGSLYWRKKRLKTIVHVKGKDLSYISRML